MKEDIQQALDGRKMHGYTVHRKERVKKYSPKRYKTNRYGGGSSGD